MHDAPTPLLPLLSFVSCLQPHAYKVRLYVLQALNLTPMDLGIGGRPGKSDPYLKVSLGKEVRWRFYYVMEYLSVCEWFQEADLDSTVL